MKISTPAVVLANHYQFACGQRAGSPRIQSRMLLWCKAGSGRVTVNGAAFLLHRDDYLFLPWNHSIAYRPDENQPFQVGGVHIIPRYAAEETVIYQAAHSPDSPLFNAPGRGDVDPPAGERIVRGSFALAPDLACLAEYTVAWFQREKRRDDEARLLARLLLEEIDLATARYSGDAPLPEELGALLSYIRNNIRDSLSTEDLATVHGCSRPTITRLFVRHLGLSPRQWIIKERLKTAAAILTTTHSSVGEAGAQVGIDDPYYFSKLFKRTYGLPPTEYRRQHSIFSLPY